MGYSVALLAECAQRLGKLAGKDSINIIADGRLKGLSRAPFGRSAVLVQTMLYGTRESIICTAATQNAERPSCGLSQPGYNGSGSSVEMSNAGVTG